MSRAITYTCGAIALAGIISWSGMEPASQDFHAGSVSGTGSQARMEKTVAPPSRNAHLEHSDDSPQWPHLEKQLRQLQQQIQIQQQTLQKQQHEIARLTHALATDASSDTTDPEISNAPAQSDEEREQIRLELLDGEFAQQKDDSEWSMEATSQIVYTVEKVLNDREGGATKGTALVDASCHATLCRIEVAGEDMSALSSFAQEFPIQLGWQASINQTVTHKPDGSVRSIIYVSRDGHELPTEEGS